MRLLTIAVLLALAPLPGEAGPVHQRARNIKKIRTERIESVDRAVSKLRGRTYEVPLATAPDRRGSSKLSIGPDGLKLIHQFKDLDTDGELRDFKYVYEAPTYQKLLQVEGTYGVRVPHITGREVERKVLTSQARALLKAGRLTRALYLLEADPAAAKLGDPADPADAGLAALYRVVRGTEALRAGRTRSAADDFRRALELDATSTEAAEALARLPARQP